MTWLMIGDCQVELRDVLNLLALVVVPIAAVLIGQWLQRSAKKREDKMRVFEAMMSSRLFGMNAESVQAANMIHVTYAHDEKVRSKWSEYYTALCIHNPSEEQCREIEDKRDAMLKAMAASLGYKDEVSQNALDAKYIPKGMVDAITQNRAQQANYDTLLREAALRFLTDQPFPKL